LFFFWLDTFPWLSKAGNVFFLHFASFPLHDAPKPAGAFFFLIHWLIEPYFLVLVYLTCMALDMIGRLIYHIKNIFYSRGA
jgi:hypothetical protein